MCQTGGDLKFKQTGEIMPPYFDREKTKKQIRLILDKLKSGGDLQLLSEYRALFKKEVPLFRRSWAAAGLLMLCDQGSLNRPEKQRGRKAGSGGAADKAGRFRERRAAENSSGGEDAGNEQAWRPLPEEESKNLFISAGRNRRVFPRELLGLIKTKTAIPREDIGAIRILDNYSFIQVRDTVADQIIEALDGQLFRGKPLAVNYARTRKDLEDGEDGEGPAEEAAGEELPEQDEDQPDEQEI
jgi:hypothetical protein